MFCNIFPADGSSVRWSKKMLIIRIVKVRSSEMDQKFLEIFKNKNPS